MSEEKDGQAAFAGLREAVKIYHDVARRSLPYDWPAVEQLLVAFDAQAEQLAAAQELSAAQAQQIEDEETAGIKQSRLIMDLKKQLATAQAERKELARTIGGCLEPDENGISVCDPPCIVCRVLGIKAQEGGG